MSITTVLGRGGREPAHWSGTCVRNFRENRTDSSPFGCCTGSSEELCRSPSKTFGIPGWGHGTSESFTMEGRHTLWKESRGEPGLLRPIEWAKERIQGRT